MTKAIDKILENHEFTLLETKHVYYTFGNSDSMFISFAGVTTRYVSVTWFFEQKDFNYHCLFLKDDPVFNSYNDIKYRKIINHYARKFNIKRFIVFGPSMGGIGALRWGLKLRSDDFKLIGIISIDPQPWRFNNNLLVNEIKNGNFKDYPKIFLNYTFKDANNVLHPYTDNIIKALQCKSCLLILQPYKSTKHLDFIPSKEYLIDIINSMENLKIEKYDSFQKWQ